MSFNKDHLSEEEIEVTQNFYKKVGEGVSTVPQIYIEEKRIGGYPQLVTWFEENGY